jgi:pyocin large subunit-like protein
VQTFGPSIGFRSRTRLDEHYAKHGREFGTISRDDYLRQAQALRDAPVGGTVLEVVRGDGTVSRFDRASGGFVAFDGDGTIRTYFRPNDGEAYFRRQARRRPDR